MARSLVVLLATSGRSTLLGRTLRSLEACRKPPCYRETIVVENGPKGEAETISSPFRESLPLRYLYRPKANKSEALNAAMERLEDQTLVFFTDDDVRLVPNLLELYAEAAKGTEGGCFYGGPIEPEYETTPPPWLTPFFPHSARGWPYKRGRESFPAKKRLPSPFYRPHFLGFNWAAFAGDLRTIGGFDPRFGPGQPMTGQETDAQERLLAAGAKAWFLPEALAWHYVPKKRCSPEWALQRIARAGKSFGQARSHGWRRWIWIRLAQARLNMTRARYHIPGVATNPRRDFLLRYNLAKWNSILDGLRHPIAESHPIRALNPEPRTLNPEH